MINTLRQYTTAYKNKITNKFWGLVSLRTKKKKKGVILLSFITGPFTMAPWEFFTDPHPNYWTAEEVARLFLERGYDVDVINWNDTHFIPRKKYAVCIDMQYNLERLSHFLPEDCKKVMFLIASHPTHQNAAEKKRSRDFEKRRGIILPLGRQDPLTSNPCCADFLVGYGNKTIHGTYASFGKEIIPIPVPASDIYDFPEDKDFEKVRTHFLWFGGGGAILKGLDLVIEAFANLPHLKLSIMGPSAYKKDFEDIYTHELALPNITRYNRPRIQKDGSITSDGIDLIDIFNQCGAIIYVSASEGGGGATVHAMQAGLFPIVSPNTGINESVPSAVLKDPTVENIRQAVEDFSRLPAEKIKELSREVWEFARKNHTKKSFTDAWENFIDNIMKLPSH